MLPTDFVYPTGYYLELYLAKLHLHGLGPLPRLRLQASLSELIDKNDVSANDPQAAEPEKENNETKEPAQNVSLDEAVGHSEELKLSIAAPRLCGSVVFVASDVKSLVNTHEVIANPVYTFKSIVEIENPNVPKFSVSETQVLRKGIYICLRETKQFKNGEYPSQEEKRNKN